VKTRLLTLAEDRNYKGESMRMLPNGAHWSMPVTENPSIDTTEIWTFINSTEDTHPIHLHLVRFQILDRRRLTGFTGRYVWHCHLLEHEDNEMMRPYDVLAR
jgi:spore coat protein A